MGNETQEFRQRNFRLSRKTLRNRQGPWWDPTGEVAIIFDGYIPRSEIDSLFCWEPTVAPIWTTDRDGNVVPVADWGLVVRHDSESGAPTIFQAVKRDSYQIHSYRQLFLSVDEQATACGLGLTSLLNLSNGQGGEGGQQAIAQWAGESLDWTLPNGSAAHGLLVASSSHDGSRATRVGVSNIMVECENTASAALLGMSDLDMSALGSARHTLNSAPRVAELGQGLETAIAATRELQVRASRLADVPLPSDDWDHIKRLWGGDPDVLDGKARTRAINRLDDLDDVLGTVLARGHTQSAWAALWALNEYGHFRAQVRDTTGSGQVMARMRRIAERQVDGGQSQLDAEALLAVAKCVPAVASLREEWLTC